MNPIAFRWDGEAMVPLPRFARECDDRFVVGQVYALEEIEARSGASHRFYFAALRDAWASLPDHLADRFRSPEALRKYALIRAGYADSSSIVASSRAEAQRLAAFIRPTDEFAVVSVEGCTVTRWTAKSQSMRAMGKRDFQNSKQAVLDLIAEMIGASTDDLRKHAAEAA